MHMRGTALKLVGTIQNRTGSRGGRASYTEEQAHGKQTDRWTNEMQVD